MKENLQWLNQTGVRNDNLLVQYYTSVAFLNFHKQFIVYEVVHLITDRDFTLE